MITAHLDEKLAEDGGAQIGDIVTAVDGVSVEDWIKDKGRYFGASNDIAHRLKVAARILRTNNKQMSLTVERGNESLTVTVPCLGRLEAAKAIIAQRKKPQAWQTFDGNVGYLHAGSLEGRGAQREAKTRLDMPGWIIDLRCYPSQMLNETMGHYFVPKRTDFYVASRAVLGEPGAFEFGAPMGVGYNNPRHYFPGKVAILVDERSISRAEFIAMALRVAPQAKVFGSTTGGADGNVSPFGAAMLRR